MTRMLEHIFQIRIECIIVDKRLRPLSEKTVIELADSIKQIGLINPIVIRRPIHLVSKLSVTKGRPKT